MRTLLKLLLVSAAGVFLVASAAYAVTVTAMCEGTDQGEPINGTTERDAG